ncbi:MAG: hypothetical protein CMQ61_05130 [Gammaproteobacteria bacterium]|nr:hypothetical protein [Gammaproteobacteria bacterium]
MYVDGVKRDTEDLTGNQNFDLSMTGNAEVLVFGTITTKRCACVSWVHRGSQHAPHRFCRYVI